MTCQSFVEDLREERDRLRVQNDKLARRVGWMEGLLDRIETDYPETREEIERSLNALAAYIEREFGIKKDFGEGEG